MAGVVDISPAFAGVDNHLVIALDVPTLKKSMNVFEERSVPGRWRVFKTTLNSVGGKLGTMFSYVDWAFAYRSAFISAPRH